MLLLPLKTIASELKVSGIFSDNMVLQHGVPVPVWGKAAVGEQLEVSFAGQLKEALVSREGRWQVVLDPLAISSTPGELRVVSRRDTVVFRDVLVGEVWLCSGQSNMGMVLREVDDAEKIIAEADYPLVRLFNVPERPAEEKVDDLKGSWMRTTPDNAASFPATPFFFGTRLFQELDVPIGLIVSAWGGSTVCAWTSSDMLQVPGIKPLVPADVLGWRINTRPSMLYNGMLYPLAPFSFRGVIWYQGESDAEYPHSYSYRFLFPNMIQCWRKLWNWPDMPFYYVQLPNIGRRDNTWGVLRESQTAALRLGRTGMINTIDIGMENKLHPTNKKDYGYRLAELALVREYDKNIPADYPAVEQVTINGRQVEVRFLNAKTLKTTDGSPPACFELAGADGFFSPAEARIQGNQVILQASQVDTPAYVRYAFDTNPQVNLVNEWALPVVAFRTDTLPVEHQESMPQQIEMPADWQRVSIHDIIRGDAQGWSWNGNGIENDYNLFVDNRFVRLLANNACQLFVMSRPQSFTTLNSPAFTWGRYLGHVDGRFDVEVNLQIYRSTAPLSGFDIQLVVNHRKYFVTIAPMRIYARENEQIILLEKNLDNTTAYNRYRISVREDGVAQVYYNDELTGLIRGESFYGDNHLLIGKTRGEGNMTVSMAYINIGQ
jgi:sialate O-acetylesterase